jgi:hypothetical protein
MHVMHGVAHKGHVHLLQCWQGRTSKQHSDAILPGLAQMLWLCSNYLLPLAVKRGSLDLVPVLIKATLEVRDV